MQRLVSRSTFNLVIEVAQNLNGLEKADAFALISTKLQTHIRTFKLQSDPTKIYNCLRPRHILKKGRLMRQSKLLRT